MKAGRHRSFDKDTALEQAMHVFWANGYAGTSLSDLTEAMGINKPSLYSAFGNKEQLYKSALSKYVKIHGSIHATHLHAVDKCLKKRIQNYLTSIAAMITDATLPNGCLICLSTSEVGSSCIPTDALQSILQINTVTRASLTEFFKNEISAGKLASESSAEVIADYLISLQFGLAVMAKNGAKFTELQQVIKFSIQSF